MIKFLSEFGPLVAFFIGYYVGDIEKATLYMFFTALTCISVCYFIERKIQTFSLVSSSVLLVSAGIALISGNSFYIKIKPTILYIIFGITFLVSAIRQKPFMQYLLHNIFQLQQQSWNILSYRFAIFFLLMAILNELVWRNCTELTWVKFKVFGVLPITLFFILLQIPFLLKNKLPNSSSDDKGISKK